MVILRMLRWQRTVLTVLRKIVVTDHLLYTKHGVLTLYSIDLYYFVTVLGVLTGERF